LRLVGLINTKLAVASAWLFVGGMLGGFLGYVFQVLMGRMLSPQEFSLFASAMSIFTVSAAAQGALLMIVSRRVSEYRFYNDSDKISHFYWWIWTRVGVFGLAVAFITFSIGPRVKSFLSAPTIYVVYLLGLLVFLAFFTSINNAFFMGLQRFSWLSIYSTLGVLLKILFSVILVWLGYGVVGALTGTILAVIVGGLCSYLPLRRHLVGNRAKSFKADHLSIRPAIPVLIANISFAAMTQLDIVIVNFYFPAHEAGIYAAASILGKAVLYISGGVSLSLFPMAVESHVSGQKNWQLLTHAVTLTSILSGLGALFYFFFGQNIVVLLFSSNYRESGEILELYGFAIFPMSIAMVAEHFLIAQGRVLFAYLFLIVAPLQLIAFRFNHDNIHSILYIMGAGGSTLALLGYGLLWREYRKDTSVVCEGIS
jgi:O-antigen/teichoic acid export membrane protein